VTAYPATLQTVLRHRKRFNYMSQLYLSKDLKDRLEQFLKMKLNVLPVTSSMKMLLYSLLSLFRAVDRGRGGGVHGAWDSGSPR